MVDKLKLYKTRLTEREPIAAAYHNHKENTGYLMVGFISAFSIFLFSNSKQLSSGNLVMDIIYFIIAISVYISALRLLYLQLKLRHGASAQCAAINTDLWLISSGQLNVETIGLTEKETDQMKNKYGLTQSHLVMKYWSKSYADTVIKAHNMFVLKGTDRAILILSCLISLFALVYFLSFLDFLEP